MNGRTAEPMWVCQDCLGDYILKGLSEALHEERVCSACGNKALSALTPEQIAQYIGEHLPKHFQLDNGLYPGYELKLEDVVGRTIKCDSDVVLRAVAMHLENPSARSKDFYWPGQEYSLTPNPFDSEDHERWYALGSWHHIVRELVHGQRFFNDSVRSFFEGLIEEAFGAEDPECPGTPALITTLDVGTTFYRGRLASSELEARSFMEKAATELGAPPKERAANNRMSPAGIPLLYVSREIDTCIAEVRPSIGDTVVVGGFQSTAPLKFFDFTKLSCGLQYTPLSLIDPLHQERIKRRWLLGYLHEEIARPVRASDTGYVATQALAEFIRYDKRWAFDGIAFQSVQYKNGVNYVLFDRGGAGAMVAPNWRPTFYMEMLANAVSLHVIEGVCYHHNAQSKSCQC